MKDTYVKHRSNLFPTMDKIENDNCRCRIISLEDIKSAFILPNAISNEEMDNNIWMVEK